MWGLLRSLHFTVDSIHKFCLDPIKNAGHTYEIFMHTYTFEGNYTNVRSGEKNLKLDFDEWKLLNPDHLFMEDQDVFDKRTDYKSYETLGDPWKNNYSSFVNHIRAIHSLYNLSVEVEKASKKTHFDAVVYLRPDVTYLNELPFYMLKHYPDALFMADFHRACEGNEYNDRMAMGNLTTAMIFGKKFEHALEYSRHKLLNSEKYTYDLLTAKNVSVIEIPFRFRRTRATGQYHFRDATGVIVPSEQYTDPIAINEDIVRKDLYCKPHPFIPEEKLAKYRILSGLDPSTLPV